MFRSTLPLTVAALLAACTESAPTSLLPADGTLGDARPSEYNVTWRIPVDASALSLRSDGLFINGGFSDYAHGVCAVEARIFVGGATTSGDATIHTTAPKGNRCGRRFLLVYPDGVSELVASFNNLNKLHNDSWAIPIGTTAPRRLILNPGIEGASRCGRVIFGDNGNVGAGTDMLSVTRVDGRTWQVQSQNAPNDRALCESTGQIFNMRVSFTIVGNRDLP